MPRELKNQELLKKVGVDYTSFAENETAKIISDTIINKAGVAKTRYVKLLNNLPESKDFTSKLVKYGTYTFDECNDLIKELQVKQQQVKAEELKVAKEELARAQARVKELEK